MPQPSNTLPINGQPMGVTYSKWLKVIRDQSGQTESDTVPDVRDPIGVTLNKILTVYLRM